MVEADQESSRVGTIVAEQVVELRVDRKASELSGENWKLAL